MRLELLSFVLVFVGGGAGSVSRYTLGLLLQPLSPRFPLATLAANALACLVLGFVIGLQLKGHPGEYRRLLMATGFCGGFSTFSTFTAETWNLFQAGAALTAVANIALSLLISLFCLLLGMKLA